ncbi:hypothetical protein [Saccharopolyspora sp. NPDC003762]
MRKNSRVALPGILIAASLIGACAAEPAPPDPFTSLADACEMVGQQTIREVVGGAHGETRSADAKRSKSCQWQYRPATTPSPPPQGMVPNFQGLSVTLFLHERLPSQADVSGIEIAKDTFAGVRKNKGMADKGTISGIGDEAYGEFNEANGYIEFRTGNVTVELRYQGTGISQQGSTGLGQDAIQAALTKAANDVNQHLRK